MGRNRHFPHFSHQPAVGRNDAKKQDTQGDRTDDGAQQQAEFSPVAIEQGEGPGQQQGELQEGSSHVNSPPARTTTGK